MSNFETLIVAAAVILLYSLISFRFSKAVQPLRLRVIDDVKSLCSDDSVPDDVKEDLRVLSENLFNKMNGWLIVTIFPLVLIRSIFRTGERRKPRLVGRNRSKVTQVIGMGMFCMIATSPLCTVIFAVEFIISLIIAGPWGWMRSLMRAVTTVDERVSSFSIIAK